MGRMRMIDVRVYRDWSPVSLPTAMQIDPWEALVPESTVTAHCGGIHNAADIYSVDMRFLGEIWHGYESLSITLLINGYRVNKIAVPAVLYRFHSDIPTGLALIPAVDQAGGAYQITLRVAS